jgi:Tol biopolymer transport system component
MSLTAGTRLGPYEILARLGAGGMGEVYRARDTRLERTVAVKVLPQRLSSSAEVRQRFAREAKLISQLSHPNICALFDVGQEGETAYLVMEYLEGETLADRLVRGPLPPDQTLRYGIQIAEALGRAHRQGIVHRDLKPGNVMLTASAAKLLDFGLARAMAPAAPAAAVSALLTEGHPLTAEGAILGTLQYMAPEQVEGRETDARTDIFALGMLLYEMATGRSAFSGASQASLAAAILRSEPPPISAVQSTSPPALDRIVRACLAKDPEERWQSAADVARELRWIAEGAVADAAGGMAAGRRGRERLAWTLAGLALLGAVLTVLTRPPPAPDEVTRFAIMPPPGQIFFGHVSLSPDARRVLFLLQDHVGRNVLAVRSLDSLELRRLPGTEDARGGFWSPDGREIAFFSEGKLKRIGVDGGPVRTVCESGGAFIGAWSREGTILFSEEFGAPLVAVPATGGVPRAATALDTAYGENWHGNPAFLPDGRHFVFVAHNLDLEKTSVMLGSLDSKQVRRLFHADSSAIFAEPGYLLFGRDGALFAWKFNPRSLQLGGEPVPVAEHVRYLREDNFVSASAAGHRVAFLTWLGRRRLVWVDRKGRELSSLGEVGGYTDVCISPDGRKVAVARRDPSHGQNQDVWVLDGSGGTGSRLTSEPNEEFNPAWFPDGEHLVYVSDRVGSFDLFERPADGGDEEVLVRSDRDKVLPTVSPDGRHLLVAAEEGGRFSRVLLPLSGKGEAVRLSSASRFSEQHPAFSPDGRFTAFDSDESGSREVYLQPFPGVEKRQISVGGGQMPVWSRDSSELFYAARDGMLMSVALHPAAGRLEIGEPQPLFLLQLGTQGEMPWMHHPYDVSADGQRFLVIRVAPDTEPDGAVVVTNWTAELRDAR